MASVKSTLHAKREAAAWLGSPRPGRDLQRGLSEPGANARGDHHDAERGAPHLRCDQYLQRQEARNFVLLWISTRMGVTFRRLSGAWRFATRAQKRLPIMRSFVVLCSNSCFL